MVCRTGRVRPSDQPQTGEVLRLGLSDTIKRGTLSKNQKNCLDLVNIEAKRQPRDLDRFSDSPEAHAARPRTRYQLSASPEAPPHKASDEVPILRLARGRLGSHPITAASTGMSHPTNAANHSRDVSRTTARHSGVTDEVGVASTPCRPGQDRAGVTGRCA